jgi:hypothetical protein
MLLSIEFLYIFTISNSVFIYMNACCDFILIHMFTIEVINRNKKINHS